MRRTCEEEDKAGSLAQAWGIVGVLVLDSWVLTAVRGSGARVKLLLGNHSRGSNALRTSGL